MKNAPTGNQSGWKNKAKFLAIFVIFMFGTYASNYFVQGMLALKVIIWFFVLGLSLAIFMTMPLGSDLRQALTDASIEWFKIVWPEKQEAMNMAMIVVLAVTVVSTLLWFIDSVYMSLVKRVLVI